MAQKCSRPAYPTQAGSCARKPAAEYPVNELNPRHASASLPLMPSLRRSTLAFLTAMLALGTPVPAQDLTDAGFSSRAWETDEGFR